jgi:hypothetical protein
LEVNAFGYYIEKPYEFGLRLLYGVMKESLVPSNLEWSWDHNPFDLRMVLVTI